MSLIVYIRNNFSFPNLLCLVLVSMLLLVSPAYGAEEPPFKPLPLPLGEIVTYTSDKFLVPPDSLAGGDFIIATTPPAIDFAFYPEQTYDGNPWSVWGDNIMVDDKWYSAIGDHIWNCYLYEYDPSTQKLRTVLDVQKLLNMPEGHYTPAKVHSRIDLGRDGWLYFSTHRGSSKYTTDEYYYKGDWILRFNPKTQKGEVVSHGPVGKESIPVGQLDPDRLIFYGGTQQSKLFFAYDTTNHELLYKSAENEGPYRYMMFSKSTGYVYFLPEDYAPLKRFNPATKTVTEIDAKIGLRSSTLETPQGYIYTVATGGDGSLFRFNVKTEQAEKIGNAALTGPGYKTRAYVTTIDADPTGTFLYYCAGNAHGHSEQGGTPVVQFNVNTGEKKVIAFLYPFFEQKHHYIPEGTFGSVLSSDGDTLYITWMGRRTDKVQTKRTEWYCAMTAIHIPESER
ncbi:MAG: hypothetical protein JXB48_17290 [Candidatus Latescibacteria bacterium]|nr:hypothetical protein [Candidatus Latescibacterota bacterium]